MKKLSSFLAIAIIGTAFLAGYILVGREISTDPKTKTGTILEKFDDQRQATSGQQQATTAEIKPIVVTDRKVDSFVNSLNKNWVLYTEKGTGNVFEKNLENQTEETISGPNLTGFLSSTWSPNKKEIINLLSSPSGLKLKYLNLETGKTSDFSSHVNSVAFSPDGNYVAYFYFDKTASASESGRIFISQPNGLYPKKILNTRLENLTLSWPLPDKLAFKTGSSEMFLLSTDGGLTKLLEQKPNLEETWSKSGRKLLFSSLADPANGQSWLQLKDIELRSEQNLNIEGRASKCVWSLDDVHVFCALSTSPLIDEIYKINSSDGSKKLVAEPEMPIKSLLLTPSEDTLLFINTSDEKLYSIKIAD